jgi:hypothetical protein
MGIQPCEEGLLPSHQRKVEWMDLRLHVFPDGPSSIVPHIIISNLEGMLYPAFPLYIDFIPVSEMSEGLGDLIFSNDLGKNSSSLQHFCSFFLKVFQSQ